MSFIYGFKKTKIWKIENYMVNENSKILKISNLRINLTRIMIFQSTFWKIVKLFDWLNSEFLDYGHFTWFKENNA